jgi:hypothetical protein
VEIFKILYSRCDHLFQNIMPIGIGGLMETCNIDYGPWRCYALACNPELSVRLAYEHFAELKIRAAANLQAMQTAAAMGKSVPVIKPGAGDHWDETYSGKEYKAMKEVYATASYSGGFPPVSSDTGSRSRDGFDRRCGRF